MRLILVLCLVAMLAIPAAAVGGQSTSSSSQGAAAKTATKASSGKKGKQRKRKQQSRRGKAQKPKGAPTQSSSSSSSSSTTDDEVEVKGPIVSLSPLTVGTTTCVVPAGFSLVGFAVGDVVEMTCDLVGGQWVLRKLELEDAPQGEVEVKGVVSSLSPLTVAGVSCIVPAGMSLAGIAVGDVVEMECRLVGGQWVVTEIELEDDDDDNSGPGGDDDDDDDNSGPGGDDDDDDDDDDDNSGSGDGDDD
jgi:hypothetical protein